MNFIDEKFIVIRITTLRNKQLIPPTYKQMKTGYMHIENIVGKRILEFARRNLENVHNWQVSIFDCEDKCLF